MGLGVVTTIFVHCYHSTFCLHNLNVDDNDNGQPWWYHLPSYFSYLCDYIQHYWRIEVYLHWWSCLKHQLHLLSICLCATLGFWQSSLILSCDPICNLVLWRTAAVFGCDFASDLSLSNSGFVFATCNPTLLTKSRSVGGSGFWCTCRLCPSSACFETNLTFSGFFLYPFYATALTYPLVCCASHINIANIQQAEA